MKGIILLVFLLFFSVTLAGLSKADYERRREIPKEIMEKYMIEGRFNMQQRPIVPKDQVLTVHVVPHTHDDVGWLKTVDEYYVGDRDDIALAGVQYILDGVYDVLMKDPSKKFTYVEMAFFTKWWKEQDDQTKQNVKELVDEGRLAFVNGGWSMSDESNMHYEDFINNMKAGHDFLDQTFGYKPSIGWHVDPFGHQSAAAALFAEMGFDAWFFARGDYQDQEIRREQKSLEFLWRPMYKNLGNRTEIFTHFFNDMYFFPAGFTFDERWGNSPIVDDPDLETFNVDERINEFRALMFDRASNYRTNQVIALFGQDFSYLNAQKAFKNIDKLIKYVNAKFTDIKLVYSTPYDYVKAIHDTGIELPVQYDDMLPYASAPHEYWSGYYTSRANFKSFVKYSSERFNTHSMCLAVDAISRNNKNYTDNLMSNYNAIYKEMGLVQHHDAISGTAKKRVMDDYSHTLFEASQIEAGQFIKSYAKLMGKDPVGIATCLSRNSTIDDCPTKALNDPEISYIDLHIMSTTRNTTILPRIPLPHGNFTFEGVDVQPDIMCGSPASTYAFIAVSVSPTSDKVIRIRKDTQSHCMDLADISQEMSMKHLSITYQGLASDGSLNFTAYNKLSNIRDSFTISNMYYEAFQDTNEAVSGAYLFRPKYPEGCAQLYSKLTSTKALCGSHVCVLMFIGDQMSTIMILNNFNDFIRLESSVSGIPLSSQGIEVFVRITSQNIKNNQTFYTDSMGLEVQKRVVNKRPYWDLEVNEPVAGNYYPINNLIFIGDDHRVMELIPDRAQGASSLRDGEIEFMMQRRLYVDDNKGVDEALNETDASSPDGRGVSVKAYTYFRIRGIEGSEPVSFYKTDLETPPYEVFHTKPSTDLSSYSPKLRLSATNALPNEVKVVAFPEGKNQIWLRVENIMDRNILDKTVTVNVLDIAQDYILHSGQKILSIEELSLTGLFTMKQMSQKLKWKGEDFTSSPVDYSSDVKSITLEPQRIRSFRVIYSDANDISVEQLLSS